MLKIRLAVASKLAAESEINGGRPGTNFYLKCEIWRLMLREGKNEPRSVARISIKCKVSAPLLPEELPEYSQIVCRTLRMCPTIGMISTFKLILTVWPRRVL